MANTISEICIKKVEDAIRGIRLNTKKPQDVALIVSSNLEKLKGLNEGMHDDLMTKYKNVVSDYNKRSVKPNDHGSKAEKE